MANRRRRVPRSLRGEVRRHSTFAEDGCELMIALQEMPEVNKVKQVSHSGRGSKTRRIVIHAEGPSLLVTIGCNDGHQAFRVFAPSLSSFALRLRLEGMFPNYQVRVRETAGGRVP